MKIRKIMCVALILALCLPVAAFGEAVGGDLEALSPVMDVVVGASLHASDLPEAVSGEDGVLTNAFVNAFFSLACKHGLLGVTEATLADPAQQESILGSIFASNLPTLSAVTQDTTGDGYLGFRPMTITDLGEGSVQIVGEMYWADQKPDENTSELEWIQPAVFVFKSDAAAYNGFRLTSFSVGDEVNMEEAMKDYAASILVEYENQKLGFCVQYPNQFEEAEMREVENGVIAEKADGSLLFSCLKHACPEGTTLQSYSGELASGHPGAQTELNDAVGSATVTYDVDGGKTEVSVVFVSGASAYVATLRFPKEKLADYQPYVTYLINSFSVFDISVG